jgi:acyl carrier protein
MSIEKIILPAAAFVLPFGVAAQDKQTDVKQTENSMPVSRNEIEKKVIKIISTKLGVPVNGIKGNMSFTNDLGADSLDLIEVIMAIEKEFHISVSDSLAEKIVTVEQAVVAADELLNGKDTDNDRHKRDGETNEQYVERIMAMAEQGDLISQSLFADLYFQSGNYTEAAKWYRKAAEQGDATAQCQLGSLYQEGMGVSKDYNEALKWYRKAAAQGFATAQYETGNMYNFGTGVPTDRVEAFKWYKKAAEQGLKEAQYNLGCQFAKGEGTSKDFSKAVSLWEKAAEQGYLMAQCNLGIAYYSGEGIKQDYVKAKYWLQKALESNDPRLFQVKRSIEAMLNEMSEL